VPADADVSAVADAIVKVVDAPLGGDLFRVHIDPSQDGAEVVNAVSDRVRVELSSSDRFKATCCHPRPHSPVVKRVLVA